MQIQIDCLYDIRQRVGSFLMARRHIRARGISCSGPAVWNRLSQCFRRYLKTFLFVHCYYVSTCDGVAR